MHILIAHSGLLDSASYTASSEATGFPVENAGNIQPSKVWRTTGKTAESLIINLGSVQTFDFIALLNTNLVNSASNTIRIRTADTAGGTTSAPDYDSTATRMIPSGAQSDYDHSNVLFQLPSTETNQYVRLDLVATANTDAYIEIGRVYVSEAFVPTRNIEYGWSMGVVDETTVTKSLGGSRYPSPSPISRELKFDLTFGSESDLYDYAFAFDRSVGIQNDVFIHKDMSNTDRYIDFSIYGLQTSLQPVINRSYAIYTKGYTVEELI